MQVVAIANGKGGVGKTSVAVEIAAGAAARGLRTVLVDLDQQGNVSSALGEPGDDGRALHVSVAAGEPPAVTETRRPNLGIVAGGSRTEAAKSSISLAQDPSEIAASLRGIDADLVVIDTPPTDPVMVDTALLAADWLLIPTRADKASVSGLDWVAGRFGELRQQGSAVQLLGILLFDIGSGSKRVRAEVRAQLAEDFGREDVILEPVVRHSERAAIDLRQYGVTSAEYLTVVSLPKADHPMAEQIQGRGLATPKAAQALAEDYQRIVEVVLERVRPRDALVGSLPGSSSLYDAGAEWPDEVGENVG